MLNNGQHKLYGYIIAECANKYGGIDINSPTSPTPVTRAPSYKR